MKKSEKTAFRIKKAMELRGYRQVDLVKRIEPLCERYDTKFSRPYLSQYLSGRSEPEREKLYLLSLALDVSIGWLMGLDVPMERNHRTNTRFEYIFEGLTQENIDNVINYANFLKQHQ